VGKANGLKTVLARTRYAIRRIWDEAYRDDRSGEINGKTRFGKTATASSEARSEWAMDARVFARRRNGQVYYALLNDFALDELTPPRVASFTT